MNWKNLLGSLFLSVAGSAFAQNTGPSPCYFDQLIQQRSADPAFTQQLEQLRTSVNNYLHNQQQTPMLKNGTANLVIPIVVYIVHNNGAENISDNQVFSQVNILNNYFDPYGIQFCLATMNDATPLPGVTTPGIIRIQNAGLTDLDADTEHDDIAATSTLPSSRYLRIWVVKDINNGGAAGFSMLPETAPPNLDGIVMDYNMFGDIATCGCTTLAPSFQNGRILVHEVGHYLGLYHTFNGGCAGMNGGTCEDEGDEVCDTPPVAQPNSGCSANNSCNESPDLPDDIHNYMDYTAETCLTDFTDGQRDRMHAMIALYRSQLVSSANHTHTGINCNGGLVAGFTASSFAPCVGTSVTFTASAVSGATYTWDFGDGTTATGQTASHTYTSALNPGSVVLTVSLGSNSVSAIQTIFVEPCAPIQSTEAHWYFYNRKGLDFSSGAPVYDNAAFANNTFALAQGTVHELSAVQSDANGNLLFYTDGIRIWNNAHAPISAGLHGNFSSKKGVLIVPDPANNGQYYVFTSDVRGPGAGRGFKYLKVQVTGTTATIVPGLPVPVTAPATLGLETAPTTNAVITGETITAIRHATGYWIITRVLANGTDESMLVFNLTATGIAYHQLTFIHTLLAPLQSTSTYGGNVEASPNGKYIVTTTAYHNSPEYLLEFDRCTGTISNPRQLSYLNCNDFQFSPDSKLLYGVDDGEVYQFNLEPCAIEHRLVGTYPSGSITAMEMGPDNKIYGVVWQTTNMITIHRPNNLATASNPNACQFTPTGPATPNGMVLSACLPNMIDANTLPSFTNTISATVNRCAPQCNTLRFEADLCAPAYSWNFGDPASGGNNTSTLVRPSHTFSSNGTYTVTLTANGSTYTTTVTVGVSPAITGSLTICPTTSMAGNYNATIPPGYTVQWTATGGTVSGLSNQPSVLVNWTSLPGTVTLTLTDNETGCISTRTITVTQNCAPTGCACDLAPTFTYGVNPSDCDHHFYGSPGGSGCLQNVTYSWSFGDGSTATGQTSGNIYTSPGTYQVCFTATAIVNGAPCTATTCQTITVTCGEEPTCNCGDLQPSYTYVLDDCTYHFQATVGSAICEENTVYYWDFGDGATATGPAPSHSYASPGTYVTCVKAVLFDANGNAVCDQLYCKEIVVECEPATCDCNDLHPSFTYTFDPKDCVYSFTAESGANCDLNTEYEWHFGDGATSIGQNAGHVYTDQGTYVVCVKVIIYDNYGNPICSDEYCEEIVVECKGRCECQLDPSFSILGGGNCDLVFGATSGSDCVDIIAYDWYVNGNYVSSGELFHYQFGVNTSYEVCVVVKGHTPDGDCDAVYCKEFFFTDCYPALPKASLSSEPAIGLFPNPASQQVTITYAAAPHEAVTIALRSADGRLLQTLNAPDGVQSMTLDLPDGVANGVVLVEVTIGARRYTERLMLLRD